MLQVVNDSNLPPSTGLKSMIAGPGSGFKSIREGLPWQGCPKREEELRRAAEAPFIERRKKAAKRGYTSLLEHDWQVTFESLEMVPANEIPVRRLKNWNPASKKKGALLFGNVGTGKSTLCKALINQWATPTFRCLFISVADAMQRLKDAIDSKETTVGMEENKIIAPNFLVLDDLGAEKSSDWAQEKLFVIFEKRANQGKHTFFTSNLDGDRIKLHYGERIHDRMIEFCSWVRFDGESFRKKNFKNEI